MTSHPSTTSDTTTSGTTGAGTADRAGPAEPVLAVDGLGVRFRLRDATVQAVTDLHLTVRRGELLAVVGESGCGKSVLAHALLGLLPGNATVTGQAVLHPPPTTGTTPSDHPTRPDRIAEPDRPAGPDRTDEAGRQARSGRSGRDGPVELVGCGERQLATRVRGRQVGLVPQSPATALNPVRTGRRLLEETLRAHGLGRAEAPVVAEQVAADVGLNPADLDRYPHELSGGMAQRLVTALALAPDPPLLLADEPTSGLDRPLVEQTLDLLRRRCDSGNAVVLITHDLAAARRVADTVAVMYASRVVEHRPAARFFAAPVHPYAAALLEALPDRAFRPVPGYPPMLTALPAGCAFAPRCRHATATCRSRPEPARHDAGTVACHHPLSPGASS